MKPLVFLISMLMAAASAYAASPAPQLRGQGGPSDVENRLAKMERLLDGGALVDLTMRLETLQKEVTELRGQLEELSNSNKQLTEQQRTIYVDLDGRVQGLEENLSKLQSGGPAIAKTGDSPSETDPVQARTDYQKAVDLIKARRYDDATVILSDIVQKYPKTEYAGNAQYWLGELNFAKSNFKAAADEFNKVVTDYASNKRVPDALLKRGFSYYELGDFDNARGSLTEVTQKYPQSTAARLADQRLQKMKKEGH